MFRVKWWLICATKMNWPVCSATSWETWLPGRRRRPCLGCFAMSRESRACLLTKIFLASITNSWKACAQKRVHARSYGEEEKSRKIADQLGVQGRRPRWLFHSGLPETSPHCEWLCLANRMEHLVIDDLHTLKKAGDLSFANHASGYTFSEDPRRLLVVTESNGICL
jgi:hypothetical protein